MCYELKKATMTLHFQKNEITNIFLRPRITTLLTKVMEFQYKLLHGAIYIKENLLKFCFVEIIGVPFVSKW